MDFSLVANVFLLYIGPFCAFQLFCLICLHKFGRRSGKLPSHFSYNCHKKLTDECLFSGCSVMNLLAEIYSQDQMMSGALDTKKDPGFDLNEAFCADETGVGMNSKENPFMLSVLAPRLWPFMRHSITSVRYSAIRTLVSFF